VLGKLEEGARQPRQALSAAARRGDGGAEERAHAGKDRVHHAEVELLLALEVVVEGALGHAAALGDLVHRHVGVVLVHEQPLRGRKDGLNRLL
jgi:hypothetical protein